MNAVWLHHRKWHQMVGVRPAYSYLHDGWGVGGWVCYTASWNVTQARYVNLTSPHCHQVMEWTASVATCMAQTMLTCSHVG